MASYLAVETSSRAASVYWHDDQKAINLAIDGGLLSSDLTAVLHNFLESNQRSLDDLSHILVSKGPGNYTSLRLGLSFVQGLALTRPIKITTFYSHDVVADTWRSQNKIENGDVAVYIDARGGQVLGCRYRIENFKLKRLEEVVLSDPAELLDNWPKSLTLVGSACLPYAKLIEEKGFHSFSNCDADAASLLKLKEQGFGEDCLLQQLIPFYIRSPV